MKNLFERTSSNWVRYSEYEWRAAEDQRIVLDAINIGRMGMSKHNVYKSRARKNSSDREAQDND